MGNILLIGGSPMVGKTTAAHSISRLCSTSCMSTDDLVEAVQVTLAIPTTTGKNYLEYYRNTPVEKLIEEDTVVSHKRVALAIQRLIYIHSSWSCSLVIEGWALYPHLLKAFDRASIFSVWLIANEDLLRFRINHSRFLSRASDIEKEHYLQRSFWHNTLLLSECKVNNKHYIILDGTETEEEVITRIFDVTGLQPISFFGRIRALFLLI